MLQIDPESQGMVISSYGHDNILVEADDSIDQGVDTSQWSQVDYAMLSPYVYGFSLGSKYWGRFHVNTLSDVSFRDEAFSHLVMGERDKELIHNIIRNFNKNVSGDFVEGKGGGCVFLFHGKPGLGKTLTAEAVAEEVRKPLYTVSVGELGVSLHSLEDNLKNILDMAARWDAVLLLDEADIFLETRSSGDIQRNAMVGTFLRLLEYYNGILVLTSNRVTEIDPAFYSRISFARRYEEQGAEVRAQIFRNLLSISGVMLSDEDIKEVSSVQSNGRQLKNSLRLALLLAGGDGRRVRKEDVLEFLTRMNRFQESLSLASKEEQ